MNEYIESSLQLTIHEEEERHHQFKKHFSPNCQSQQFGNSFGCWKDWRGAAGLMLLSMTMFFNCSNF
jgi:hypothetical protein